MTLPEVHEEQSCGVLKQQEAVALPQGRCGRDSVLSEGMNERRRWIPLNNSHISHSSCKFFEVVEQFTLYQKMGSPGGGDVEKVREVFEVKDIDHRKPWCLLHMVLSKRNLKHNSG